MHWSQLVKISGVHIYLKWQILPWFSEKLLPQLWDHLFKTLAFFKGEGSKIDQILPTDSNICFT